MKSHLAHSRCRRLPQDFAKSGKNEQESPRSRLPNPPARRLKWLSIMTLNAALVAIVSEWATAWTLKFRGDPAILPAGTLRGLAISSGSFDLPLSLSGPSFSQQSHRSPLTSAAKQQRISQRRTLHDLARPLVVPGKLHANCEICTALNQ